MFTSASPHGLGIDKPNVVIVESRPGVFEGHWGSGTKPGTIRTWRTPLFVTHPVIYDKGLSGGQGDAPFLITPGSQVRVPC